VSLMARLPARAMVLEARDTAEAHRGQRWRHMKTICVKRIWFAYEVTFV
jgi:hypothetical protein